MSTVAGSPTSVALEEGEARMLDTLKSEARLLTELGACLRRQRAAVAADDLGEVEQTVYAIHRVLVTLGEARRRRESLATLLGHREPGLVGHAREKLRETAVALSREVDVTRQVLNRALGTSDEAVRTFLAHRSEGLETTYGDGGPASGGVLLRRRA
jgi:hypothetical protein